MVDKYEAKQYVKEIIGEEYIIPTLAVWDRVEDIDFDSLPEQFVLKCTHDSGGLVICKDKSKLDIEKAKKRINKSLRRNYFYNSREWPYKKLKPRIIAEMYMEDESGYELKDYKFFCFDGEVKALFIATDRGVEGEEKEKPLSPEAKEAKKFMQASYTGRMLLLVIVAILAVSLPFIEAVPCLLALLFPRISIFLTQMIRNKKEANAR